MKKMILVCAMLLGAYAGLQAQHDHNHGEAHTQRNAEIKGHVIDIVCYTRHAAIGEKHLKCATTCAKTGIPMGILEDGTNEIYLVFPPGHKNPNEQLMAYLEKDVTVNGTLHHKGGIKGITISSIVERK